MFDHDEEATRRRFAEASDEELYDILARPNSHVSEALEAARDALRSRNLNPETAAALEASAAKKTAGASSAAARSSSPMKWVVLVLVVASLGIGIARGYVGAVEKSKTTFLHDGIESCTRVLVDGGVPEVTAQPICVCRIRYFVDHNSASKVRQYLGDRNSPEARKAILEAAAACEEPPQ